MTAAPARRAAAVALACAGAALGGCAADRISGVREAQAQPAAPAAGATQGCPFRLEAVDDARREADLGVLGRTRVGGQHFVRWLTEGIASTPGFTREMAPVLVHIEIAKAYVHGLSSLKSANIVVNARISGPHGPPVSRTYRGVDSSMNWASGEGEVQEAFDRALQDLRSQLARDLSGACSHTPRQG